MATTIFVVRHGQDEDNAEKLLNGHRNRPLTEMGQKQALVIAERIKALDVDVVVASPLKRAHDTARAIHAASGLPEDKFVVYDDLKERDFGCLTGKPLSDIKKVAGDNVLETENVTYFLDVDGAETFPVLLQRAKSILAYVNATYPGQRVVLTGHGDINKMIRAAYLGWTWEQGLTTAYVGNTDVIQLPAPAGQDSEVMKFD
eukprot:TRINITY_DN25842_c0_g1_i1.p1 TRINITY_DN25842_c0_g1~~TRINITY_DN25842_c0_g1_i1.p1  ORF type:complete len:202 (+),score=80.97 TRINITY_DN25842_c0_g1_i1:52-657(+)